MACSIDISVPCFEVGDAIHDVLVSLLAILATARVGCQIFLTDDGSSPDRALTDRSVSRGVKVLRHALNRGRAAACNTGARSGTGELIWFLDADCVPASAATLQAHLKCIEDHDVSVGPIGTRGNGFWAEYQRGVADRRIARLRRDMDVNACTSANLMVRRKAFEAVGGFDERYTRYGFEDRDLFLRLMAAGARLGFAEGAVAFHDATLDLATVCRKMFTSARYSSTLFRAAHPDAYRATRYGQLDARNRGAAFRTAVGASWRVLRACMPAVNQALEVRVIPFAVRAAIARGYVANAYAFGTVQADSDDLDAAGQ